MRVPPVPRCNVEELLAIEAPAKTQAPSPTPPSSLTANTDKHTSFGLGRALPPIPATPESGQESYVDTEPTESRGAQEAECKEKGNNNQEGEAFFMTQARHPQTSFIATYTSTLLLIFLFFLKIA